MLKTIPTIKPLNAQAINETKTDQKAIITDHRVIKSETKTAKAVKRRENHNGKPKINNNQNPSASYRSAGGLLFIIAGHSP